MSESRDPAPELNPGKHIFSAWRTAINESNLEPGKQFQEPQPSHDTI